MRLYPFAVHRSVQDFLYVLKTRHDRAQQAWSDEGTYY